MERDRPQDSTDELDRITAEAVSRPVQLPEPDPAATARYWRYRRYGAQATTPSPLCVITGIGGL